MASTKIRSLQSQSFKTGPQSIVSGGLFVFTHGLGVIPSRIKAEIVCVSDDAGYLSGDRTACLHDTSVNRGHSIVSDDVFVYVRFGFNQMSYPLINKTSGKGDAAKNIKWKVEFQAFS